MRVGLDGGIRPPFHAAMSIEATQLEPPTVTCRGPFCNEEGRKWEFQKGYCSNKCDVEDDGFDAIASVKYDHTICYTCGADLKETTGTPSDDFWAEKRFDCNKDRAPGRRMIRFEQAEKAFIGFQYRIKPNTDIGEKTVQHKPEISRTAEVARLGTICDICGNTAQSQRMDEIWSNDPEFYAERLLKAVIRESDETIFEGQFWDAFEGDNFEYAIGMAVDG